MISRFLGGQVQLPREQWGTELQPFNEQFSIDPARESWDVVESVAQRLGINMQVEGDNIYLLKGPGQAGKFPNSTGGISLALKFLEGIT